MRPKSFGGGGCWRYVRYYRPPFVRSPTTSIPTPPRKLSSNTNPGLVIHPRIGYNQVLPFLEPIPKEPSATNPSQPNMKLYLVELPDAPEGYRYKRIGGATAHAVIDGIEVLEYRAPKKGEHHLIYHGRAISDKHDHDEESYPFFILEKIEPAPIPPAPEGFDWLPDEKGERRSDIPSLYQWFLSKDGKTARQRLSGMEIFNPRYILVKKKPSYTEAVKAAGFIKWPFNVQWTYAAYTPNGLFRGYSREPKSESLQGNTGWFGPLYTDDILRKDFLPPRLADQYEWHETLLKREDFE